MQERLSLIGGSHRFLNMFAAMKIGGFADPSIIYEAIRNNEFEINRKLCPGDPEEDRAWIQIETISFLQWLERRGQVDIVRLRDTLRDIDASIIRTHVKIGEIQHHSSKKIDRLERHIESMRGEICRLTDALFENRIKRLTGRSTRGRVKRRRRL